MNISNRLILSVTFALTALVGSASASDGLYCVSSNYATPSETAKHAAMAYRTVQVDPMGDGLVQIDITDDYGDGKNSAIFKAKWSADVAGAIGQSAGGFRTGLYKALDPKFADSTLAIEDGVIQLWHGDSPADQYPHKYGCEDPSVQ